MQAARVRKRGAIVVPAKLRQRFGIEEGSMVVAEETEDGILIRPAVVVPIERYTPERKAEFLLSNAIDAADYREAKKDVRRWALIQIQFLIGDPDGSAISRRQCFIFRSVQDGSATLEAS